MAPMVRKQSLLATISSFPFDVLLWINEARLLIDWDDYSTSLALPLGISLTIVVIIFQSVLNYYEGINGKSNNLLFSSDYTHYEQLKSTLVSGTMNFEKYIKRNDTSYTWILQAVVNIITIGSLITTYKLFRTYREYGLLYLKNKQDTSSLFKRSLKVIPNKIYSFLFKSDQLVEENKYDDDIWILNVWNPSKFSLFLFIGLNPINMAICLLNSITLPNLVIILLVSSQLFVIIYKFHHLIGDQKILNQELLKEYTNKVVNPYTSKLKKDVQIDSTIGPYYSEVLVHPTGYVFNKLKVFKTHDLKGNEIKETVEEDDKFHSFDDNNKIIDDASFYPESREYRRSEYFDEPEELSSDDWYVSSTPYNHHLPSRSQSHSPFKSPDLRSSFHTNKFSSPNRIPPYNGTPIPSSRQPPLNALRNSRIPPLNATPLPYTSLHGRPSSRSPDRSVHHSPERSIHRSPGSHGPSYNRSPVRSYRTSQPSSREHSPNRTYMRSPSPSKRHQSSDTSRW